MTEFLVFRFNILRRFTIIQLLSIAGDGWIVARGVSPMFFVSSTALLKWHLLREGRTGLLPGRSYDVSQTRSLLHLYLLNQALNHRGGFSCSVKGRLKVVWLWVLMECSAPRVPAPLLEVFWNAFSEDVLPVVPLIHTEGLSLSEFRGLQNRVRPAKQQES